MINDIITYLIKSTIISAVLYLIYWFWLRRESFFSLSRWYLLCSLLFSYFIPLVHIKVEKPIKAIQTFTTGWQHSLNQFQFTEQDFTTVQTSESFNWNNLLIGLYAFAVLVMIVRFVVHLIKIYLDIRGCSKIKHGKYSLILTKSKPAYSFFNYIFLPKEFYNTQEGNTIIHHESVHIIKNHSVDRIFIELLLILFWFNPIIHLIRKSLIEAHEYEADRDTTKEIESIQSYYNLVLDLAYCRRHSPFINHFSYKQLKKRIKMATHHSNPIKKGLIIVPIIAIAIIFGFASVEIEKNQVQYTDLESVKWPDFLSSNPDSVFTCYELNLGAPSRIISHNNYLLINYKNVVMLNGNIVQENNIQSSLAEILSDPAITTVKKLNDKTYPQVEVPILFMQKDVGTDSEFAEGVLDKVLNAYKEVRNQDALQQFYKEFDQCNKEEKEKITTRHPVMISFGYKRIGQISNNSTETPFILPIKDYKISGTPSGWGYRMDPIYKIKRFHKGIDYKAHLNTKILAIGDGIVREITNSTKGYGKHLIIDHENGYSSLYAHVNDFNVKKGQPVRKGSVIAFVGNTGVSTGPHLHLEIMKDGENVNPTTLIDYKSDN